MKYEPIIGLEVHVQVKTKSKMFCDCPAAYFNNKPNSHVCPVCLGLPGALPVPNKLAVEKCLRLALALNCSINKHSKFDRKNYFYPDLPKGYQISQFDLPFGYEGYFEIGINGDNRRIRVTRVHMEEDTGKSLHEEGKTLLDYNKSGIPLAEIVSEPDFTSTEEVLEFAKRLRQTVRYLDISDANMERGQMRFELNMSLREQGKRGLPDYKVEVKNIGSISVLEKVINFESARQAEILESGKTPTQETRGLKDMTGETVSQRIKEESEDYRYFPEPDIPPLNFSDKQIKKLEESVIELPQAKKDRYVAELGLEPDTAETIISKKARFTWFEKLVKGESNPKLIKELAKWLIGDLSALLKADRSKLADLKFNHTQFKNLISLLLEGKLSGTLAKKVLAIMYKTGRAPEDIVKEEGMEIVSDTAEIKKIARSVINDNKKVAEDVKKNPNAVKFLVGQIMQVTRGKANPNVAEQVLREMLELPV
ncbi:MAG: Asp-tRNA(Asn)/Glu-tRNA(Gln) amidotransferase subunit GatB [Candidatus Dojkabacteria bacterium]